MRPCTHCGKAIENNAQLCPHCHQEQRQTVGVNSSDPARIRADVAQETRERLQESREMYLMMAIALAPIPFLLGFGDLIGGETGLIAGGILAFAWAFCWGQFVP